MVKPAEPKPRKPRGICCPTCEVRLRTRETRQRPDQAVRRVKWCPQCGYTVETMERVRVRVN